MKTNYAWQLLEAGYIFAQNERKALSGTLEPFKKRRVKQLQAYYKKGKRWYRVGPIL